MKMFCVTSIDKPTEKFSLPNIYAQIATGEHLLFDLFPYAEGKGSFAWLAAIVVHGGQRVFWQGYKKYSFHDTMEMVNEVMKGGGNQWK